MEKKLVLGTVQMGLDYGINNKAGKIPVEESFRILKKAFELGINTIDTAEAYGSAHQVIGNFHRLNSNIQYKIITKFPHEIKKDEVEQKIVSYVEELNVNNLEVLMFHSFDSYQKNKETLPILNNLKSRGLIKNIGVSVYTNFQIEVLLSEDEVSVIQLPFNLLDNEFQRGDLLEKAKLANKEIHTRSAFLQGLFFKNQFNDEVSLQLEDHLVKINNISEKEGISLTELALSYCLAQRNIDKVLIGVDSENQLIENVLAADYKISDDIIGKIKNIKVKNIDLLNPSLWK
ncbi:aldo/keto reductase [Flavobacterium sp. GN10]|uniref:Aldo/keto reductase n=1 Tax=Flavobacterium tagetis TaxID=2801336 RepID=A0ABS1KH95_9FLAO|nr:aldo/keto reductase [Flavobacterium tagetis]MBL0738850.1 aldo/keto reductase [Flavobacterium tagetis]